MRDNQMANQVPKVKPIRVGWRTYIDAVLLESKFPLTAKEIANILTKKFPEKTLYTIYSNVSWILQNGSSWEESKYVKHIIINRKKVKYSLRQSSQT